MMICFIWDTCAVYTVSGLVSKASEVAKTDLNIVVHRRLWTKVHQIRSADAEEIAVCKPFSYCRYLVPFRRYSRSKCEVVRNRAKNHVFRPQIFLGGPPNFGLVF